MRVCTYTCWTMHCNGSKQIPLSDWAYGENRTMTNSRDGCGVSGMSITVHLITHQFWSGTSSECGICYGVSPSAQQLCNRLTSLLPSLSFFPPVSLYLSLYSAHGWFGRVTWAVSYTQTIPEFLNARCVRGVTKSEKEFDEERCERTWKTKAVRQKL